MPKFFQDGRTVEVIELTGRMRQLQQLFLNKNKENAEANTALANKYTTVADDMDTLINYYTVAIYSNTNNRVEREVLISDFESIVVCLEAICNNHDPQYVNNFIKGIEKTNKALPYFEALQRVIDGLFALFWLGGLIVSSVSFTISLFIVPQNPAFGIAFTLGCFGLMYGCLYKAAKNLQSAFGAKDFYNDYRLINVENISLLNRLQDSYEPAVETSLAPV
ncbi:hypothetical protein A8135_02295 [Legionella jamestowniensis]|uniref:DUF5638 domain-containing protein n=1 Tax=Legionella jamestowniensis TaxID=455 RepID=A0ABX2XSX4_9GAMM|nr:hypothetical protein [Legionella jamestowniensis]OCH97690.1 hypothetical protein A8135_02295 [Legionella jamestowniensis]